MTLLLSRRRPVAPPWLLLLSVLFAALVFSPTGASAADSNDDSWLDRPCYYPNGQVNVNAKSCGRNTGHCCDIGTQTCLSNGLCWGSVLNRLARNACTDSSWSDPSCGRVCRGSVPDGVADVRPCDNDGTRSKWTCGINPSDCANPFSVPEGVILDERPFAMNAIRIASRFSASSDDSATDAGDNGAAPSAVSDNASDGTCSGFSSSSDSGVSGRTIPESVFIGVVLGLGVPLVAGQLIAYFFFTRARSDAREAKAELVRRDLGEAQARSLIGGPDTPGGAGGTGDTRHSGGMSYFQTSKQAAAASSPSSTSPPPPLTNPSFNHNYNPNYPSYPAAHGSAAAVAAAVGAPSSANPAFDFSTPAIPPSSYHGSPPLPTPHRPQSADEQDAAMTRAWQSLLTPPLRPSNKLETFKNLFTIGRSRKADAHEKPGEETGANTNANADTLQPAVYSSPHDINPSQQWPQSGTYTSATGGLDGLGSPSGMSGPNGLTSNPHDTGHDPSRWYRGP